LPRAFLGQAVCATPLLRSDARMSASHSLDKSLIKALSHPLRWEMLELLTERGDSSPVELARLLDQPLATISHHMRVLRDLQCVELTRTEQRRGAIEHYYRPLAPAFFDDEQWASIPVAFRRAIAGQIFRRIVDEAAAAGEAGAFDLPTAHIDRMLVELDELGRHELSDLLTEALRRTQEIQERSDARAADDGDARLSVVAVLHFELPDARTAGEGTEAAPLKRGRSPRLP
jgi:DNA-binding transcriptional ArsR family regulator